MKCFLPTYNRDLVLCQSIFFLANSSSDELTTSRSPELYASEPTRVPQASARIYPHIFSTQATATANP
jgi:hypothetical protein